MPLIPKDDGVRLMIYAFASRELRYGVDITDTKLVKINECRRGKEYSDKGAARNKLGNAIKQILINLPFVIYFEYSNQGKGYWNYNAMPMQFEDFTDCMKVLYPRYDCIFLFDHLCGHYKKQPDRPNANVMTNGYGGKQSKMKNLQIVRKRDILANILNR